MKTKYKIIAVIFLTGTLGYIVGQLIPIEYLKPTVEREPIKSNDYYNLIIQGIAASVTLLAVIIALFREEIRRWWEFVRIEYSVPEDKFEEVINPTIGNPSDGDSQPIEAEKYLCAIEVINSGTISAHSSEIILESASYKSNDSHTVQPLEITGRPLKWGTSGDLQITIPPKGKKKVAIFELIPPNSVSSPGGEESVRAPQLNISGVNSKLYEVSGVWSASYLIYSSNSKPRRFSIEIKWNGQWQRRLTEMRSCLTIDIK